MKTIAVIGLGYVGLPLAVEFAKKTKVIAFDINPKRINELKDHKDLTQEVSAEELKELTSIHFTCEPEDLASAQIYIVTVPTPIDQNKNPDLTPLTKASEMLSQVIKKGDLIIYESTVFPGCTEDYCVPLLEKGSSLTYNQDFYCGYSPERMNPGDKNHGVKNIVKVTSGSTPEIADEVNELYASIVEAGTFLATSIKTAEAAKVIENAQRDINIAFVNELAIIFEKMNLNTWEVLEAAKTKWNFLNFHPGLVGGHCIGVDPYYLTYKAEEFGYRPQVILAGRRINDDMGRYVAQRLLKEMIRSGRQILNAPILILGMTFKENCPDYRNTRVTDIIDELKEFGCHIHVCDPWLEAKEISEKFAVDVIEFDELQSSLKRFSSVVLAVSHHQFKTIDFNQYKGLIFDVKNTLDGNTEALTF